MTWYLDMFPYGKSVDYIAMPSYIYSYGHGYDYGVGIAIGTAEDGV